MPRPASLVLTCVAAARRDDAQDMDGHERASLICRSCRRCNWAQFGEWAMHLMGMILLKPEPDTSRSINDLLHRLGKSEHSLFLDRPSFARQVVPRKRQRLCETDAELGSSLQRLDTKPASHPHASWSRPPSWVLRLGPTNSITHMALGLPLQTHIYPCDKKSCTIEHPFTITMSSL